MADTLELTSNEASAEHSGALQLTPDPLIGREVGGYIVEKPLGEGGMGLVFLARHPILNRHFAIKVLRPEAAADERISMNFEREAQTLSSLKHPHIIDIVGFGTLEDGRQYMVMEFVKGQTLQDELERDGKLELYRALKLADQILDGLDAAHSVGVIHRDLKPGNVLIARVSGGTEVLKLLDFGLAKQQPESLIGLSIDSEAGASVIAGTPEYIAPEQAQGKHAGKHSDLYSFGIVFCEILTGVQPFVVPDDDPDRIRTLLKMHISSPAPLISTLAPERYFPAELEELVADLLKKDPNERPSSASTVRARLQKVQRTLAQEATHMAPNPLLEFSAPTQGVVVSRSLVLEGQAQRRPSRLWIAFAVAAVLLLGFGIRLLTRVGHDEQRAAVVVDEPDLWPDAVRDDRTAEDDQRDQHLDEDPDDDAEPGDQRRRLAVHGDGPRADLPARRRARPTSASRLRSRGAGRCQPRWR